MTDKEHPRDHLRDALRPLRNAMGLSLAGVEAATGILAVRLGSWERNQRMPPVPVLIDLIEFYGSRIVIVGPDEHVVPTSASRGEERIVFVVVSPDGVEVTRENATDADVLAKAMPGSKIGYRIDRIGTVEFGLPPGGAWW